MELAVLLVLSIASARDEIVKLSINHGDLRSSAKFFRKIYLILFMLGHSFFRMLHYFYPEVKTIAYYLVSLVF